MKSLPATWRKQSVKTDFFLLLMRIIKEWIQHFPADLAKAMENIRPVYPQDVMKKIFYLSLIGWILFEGLSIYCIMPLPGSQRMDSLALAYCLNRHGLLFRLVLAAGILTGIRPAFRASRLIPALCLLLLGGVIYATHRLMAADQLFLPVTHLRMASAAENQVDLDRLVIGVVQGGQAAAYPIQYLGYHHQVADTLGGQPVMITYCTVCRTGRVFSPVVQGRTEQFRLVGMDHFNAMFEDETTGSWWRQASGEAVAGPLKGQSLPALGFCQMRLGQWLALHPASRIMQPDAAFAEAYAQMNAYEAGQSKGSLTRRERLPWQEKSWVVGVELGGECKAYDWQKLEKERIIYDVLCGQPLALVLASDGKSFSAFLRNSSGQQFRFRDDTLWDQTSAYTLDGQSIADGTTGLVRIPVSQEYWHSWQTFHPDTRRGE